MGVRILQDKDSDYCCLYCSCTMTAFGPIIYSCDEAEEFLKWLNEDPRHLTDAEIDNKYYEFRALKEKENG